MGLLYLQWDASGITPANVIAYRLSKRIKTVGGAYSTTGFTPSNDIALGIGDANINVTNNKVYEFKLEHICTTGGPTISGNGVQEQIKFACIAPVLGSSVDEISVDINLTGTDITKARLYLKRQSDDVIAGGPVIVNNVADAITHTFTGLDANTGYYVTVELYATVGGIEVISSAAAYLGAVCGGNVSGYQIDTDTACTTLEVEIDTGTPTIEWTTCDGALLSMLVPGGGVTICTNGDAVIVTGGTIDIISTTPGGC